MLSVKMRRIPSERPKICWEEYKEDRFENSTMATRNSKWPQWSKESEARFLIKTVIQGKTNPKGCLVILRDIDLNETDGTVPRVALWWRPQGLHVFITAFLSGLRTMKICIFSSHHVTKLFFISDFSMYWSCFYSGLSMWRLFCFNFNLFEIWNTKRLWTREHTDSRNFDHLRLAHTKNSGRYQYHFQWFLKLILLDY